MDKLPFSELEKRLKAAEKQVVPGSRWRHYKGNEYRVEAIVVQEIDNALAVVYTPLKHPNVSFVRSLSVWLETVDWDGHSTKRFTPVS